MAFLPALDGGFVWDDVAYLLRPQQARELSWPSIQWAFSWASTFPGHYQPLTWLSWMLDFVIAGGAEPRQFHLTNLVLHSANGVVLAVLLRLMLEIRGFARLRWLGWVIALLWCVHPLRVESVAWITERRDLLCGMFYMGSMYCWLRACGGNGAAWGRWAFPLFVVSLLCKAWAITFPVVLWVLDAFLLPSKFRRHQWSPLAWWEAHLQYVVVSVAFAAIAWLAQDGSGAGVAIDDLHPWQRLLQAAYAWWWYPVKTVWPVDLYPFHAWSSVDFRSMPFISAAVALGAFSVVLARRSGSLSRAVLGAALAYTAIILPVLGLAQSGPQLVADRYSYLAMLPWHVLVMFLLAYWTVDRGSRKRSVIVLAIPLVMVLGFMSFRQCGAWRDEGAFWTRVVEAEPRNLVARLSRAAFELQAGDHAAALADIARAERIAPNRSGPLVAEADVRAAIGDGESALTILDRALALDAHDVSIYRSRARILVALGRRDRAMEELTHAVRISPKDTTTLLQLSKLEFDLELYENSWDAIMRAHDIAGDDADVLLQVGRVAASRGHLDVAQWALEQALRNSPADWNDAEHAQRFLAQTRAMR